MKMKFLPLLALAWTCLTANLQAQQVTVSPIPQEISWGGKAFDQGFNYTITGEDEADADAVRALKNGVKKGSGTNVNIIIGERGDAAVAAYETNIPDKKEGYYLKVEGDKVIIAGNDGSGTFYGVQTFLQIASQPEVMQATVTDYPDVMDRGVIEGFYGNWWSQEDRIRQFEFYGKNKMNVYIYAPKDDPYHRGKWREPYPAAEAAKLSELVAKAKENKVQFVWSIHPGNDIQWNATDMKKVLDKFELMYDMGVRAFGLLFDDISGAEQSRADKQAELINYVTDNFIKKYPELPPIIFCPTQYNQAWSSGNYLDVLGDVAYKEARIMWTGKSVVRMIDKETMDWINAKLKRNAYIWLNYPTNDYCIDRMLMGPTYGNDKNIANQLSGFTANPSEYAEASKVSLYSIADYTWNMTDYDENASWERAIKYLMPEHAEAFHIFCENNIDLGNTFHGLRRKDESKRFAEAIKVFESEIADGMNKEAFDKIKPMFDEFVNSCTELLDPQLQENDPLAKELVAWFQVMKLMGERGQKMCSLYAAIADNRPEDFISTYKEMQQLEAEQKAIRSRDFEGSIKSPNPTVAGEVVAPFMSKYTGLLIGEYKKHFDEGWENFPAVLLADGKYYIKYNGKFLTNVSGSQFPTFVANEDDINPQRQEWTISMDYSTGRYSVINAQDQRYLNEKGEFTVNNTTNPFDAAWHTYNITRAGGKYAIQNGGSAGTKYWTSNGTRISTGTRGDYHADNFMFELIPLEGEQVTHPTLNSGASFHIINPADGKYLTENGTNDPQFQVKKDKDTNGSQLWTITKIDANGRFKIVSVSKGKNLNENAQFGTAYADDWNTFKMLELGGNFSIQCAGSAGNDFWYIEGDRIRKAGKTQSESYVFKLVEVGEAPMDEEAKTVFSKRGLVTDASQIADGSYVVIQNVNTSFAERQGFLAYENDTKFITYLSGYYQTNLAHMKSSFPDRYVFEIEKNDQGISFKNVASGKYIPNNVASGTYAPSTDASKSKFVLSASAKADMSWAIKSTANNMYINGEPGNPVAWSDEHPMRIYLVEKAVADNEVTPGPWFFVQTTDGNANMRMTMGEYGDNFLRMKSKRNAAGENMLWSLVESPTTAGRYTFVNKSNEQGSADWLTTTDDESLIEKFDYLTDSRDFGIYVKPQSNTLLPECILYRVNDGSSYKRFLRQDNVFVKESASEAESGKMWKLIPAANLKMFDSKYAAAAFSAPVAVTIPQGMYVYIATKDNGSTVSMKRVEGKVIPANTAVVLVNTKEGGYEMAPAASNDGAINAAGNLLKSSTPGAIMAPAKAMTLALENNLAVMKQNNDVVPGYSIYMVQKDNEVAKTLEFDQLPPTTGIEDNVADPDKENGKIYDLSGREVLNPTKGIYIRNGKKIIVNK